MNFDKYKLTQFANLNLIPIQVFAQYVPNFGQSRTWTNSVRLKMDEQTDREARARRNLLREPEEEEDTGSSSEEVFIIFIFLY